MRLDGPYCSIFASEKTFLKKLSFLIKFFYLLIFGCARSLLLCGLFSSCSKWGSLFVAVHSLFVQVASTVAEHGLQGEWASGVAIHGLSNCGLRALECNRKSCGAQPQLLCSMQDLSRSGIEPTSPALAGEFFTIEPQGKPQRCCLNREQRFL